MRQTAAKCVPPLLNNNQTQSRLFVCKHLQDHAKKTNFLCYVITRLAMKIQLKGRRHKDISETDIKWQAMLDSIRQREFQECLQYLAAVGDALGPV